MIDKIEYLLTISDSLDIIFNKKLKILNLNQIKSNQINKIKCHYFAYQTVTLLMD